MLSEQHGLVDLTGLTGKIGLLIQPIAQGYREGLSLLVKLLQSIRGNAHEPIDLLATGLRATGVEIVELGVVKRVDLLHGKADILRPLLAQSSELPERLFHQTMPLLHLLLFLQKNAKVQLGIDQVTLTAGKIGGRCLKQRDRLPR
jgi:hypothetical protein